MHAKRCMEFWPLPTGKPQAPNTFVDPFFVHFDNSVPDAFYVVALFFVSHSAYVLFVSV